MITERDFKNNEENFFKYFEGLAKSVSEIIILVDPITFKIKYINRIQPGYSLNQVLGAVVFDFVFPEHINYYQKALKDCIDSHQSKTIDLETTDIINESGKAWYKCTITPIINFENKIDGLLIASKDITAEKLYDIEISNKKEKLFAIINNTNDIILSIDQNFNLTEYNSVFATIVEMGYNKTNLVGQPILNFIDPTKHYHLKNIYEKVFKGETINDIEVFAASKNDHIYFESSYHPIFDYTKQIIGISIFSKNITDRVKDELKIKKALKDKDVLLSEIHHRIKNNLALVSSMLQLKEMNIENVAAKEALSDSRKRIKSTALVHEMLYRNDSFDNLKLKQYINELFSNLNVNAKILLDIEGDDHVLDLNKALPFGLMLHELMMNSFKHSFKDGGEGTLSICSKLNEGELVIEYCDCRGVFPNNVDFYDTSTTGLMLIHTFAEQVNGTVKLVSKAPPSYEIIIPLI